MAVKRDFLGSLTGPFLRVRQNCRVEKRSRRRIAGVAAASWILATAVTSFVVWRAVAVFNDGASTNILSAPQVSERLQAAKATQTPTTSAIPTQATTPSPTTDTPSPETTSESDEPSTSTSVTATRTSASSAPLTTDPQPAATVVTTWTVNGGTVSVACQEQVISLVYASPQDGWRIETEKHGTDRIDINFERVGQGTELRATCAAGTPQQTNQPTNGDR